MNRLHIAMTLLLAVAVAACEGVTELPERVVTSLECDPTEDPDAFNCALELQEPAALRLQLETFTCAARGNTLRLLEPIDQVLTTDACYVPSGTVWELDGPYEAGTVITLEFISARLELDPGFEITGEYPTWVVNFEDGGDRDFDDLVLTVTADPAS